MLILALYIGYLAGGVMGIGIQLDTLNSNISYVFSSPFRNYVNVHTKNTIAVSIIIYFLVFLNAMTRKRNYMPGKEYGSSQWANIGSLNKKFKDKEENENRILTKNFRMSLDAKKTMLNKNILCVGGAGSGKTSFLVKNNAYQCNETYIFTDPKGELLRDIGGYLREHGYVIKVLNLIEMDKSNCYNPFSYIREEADVIKLITNLIANTTPKGSMSQDPFWEKAESLFLQALFYFVWMEYPRETRNFNSVMELLGKAKVDDDGEKSELDIIMERLALSKGEDHPAYMQYKKCINGAGDTVRSIIVSANARLAYLENNKLKRILDHDEMDIASFGVGRNGDKKTKTALFCCIPDNHKSYNFIVGMLYTQIFQELYYQADFVYGGELPIPVSFWMDEFANVALPDDYTSLVSTMRSRNISSIIIIQNLAQIKALFKDTWETITGNCDILLYLGGNEQSTHKYISEELGKWTIDKRSTGETLGHQGHASRNEDVLGRELMTPDEVRKMSNRKAICLIRGEDPVLDYKYGTFTSKEFLYAKKLGPYIHNVNVSIDENGHYKAIPVEQELELLGTESMEYFKNLQIKGDNIVIHSFSLEDFLSIDFGNESEMEEEINWDEVSQAFQTKEEGEINNSEVEVMEEPAQTDNKKIQMKGSFIEIIKNNDFNKEQYKEIELGFSNGLTEKQILKYLNPGYEAEKMAIIRKLLLTEKTNLQEADSKSE